MKISLSPAAAAIPHARYHRRSGTARLALGLALLLLTAGAGRLTAQNCYTASDMDPATRTGLEGAAAQDFRTAQQNASALQAGADFSIGEVIAANQELFQGQAKTRSVYLLDNSQPAGQRSEFFCGIFNSSNRVAFVFSGLPTGRYGIVIQDVAGTAPGTVSWVLRQSAGQWRVAGLTPKPGLFAGHDGNWYLSQARAYRAQGQHHNAWFYYKIALDLLQPLGALNTPLLERLDDEALQSMPADLPVNGRTFDLALDGRVYRLSEVFATPVGSSLDLVVKYQEPDISDATRTYQSNLAIIRGLATRFPELRAAFAAVVARAVTPAGQEYGTLLAMQDIK